ncbi:hypothetical protein DD237_008468 [Peronospora effusa]|uniref:Uncharacterized protein n=1 Tax=Peronospora effusa TaxID=542832 RepID=A0A3R7XQF7_9STRA|nr:hypothetical protein DD237_008468 [Peronospora effusa]
MTDTTYNSWGCSADRFDGSMCLGVGIWHIERHHVKILKNRVDRGRTTPSVVRFDPDSHHVDVGNEAVKLETLNPVKNTIRSVKRLLGQKFKSQAIDVARIYASYDVVPTDQGNVAIQVARGKKKVYVQPEEISACVLKELKSSAESYFDGHTIFDNVVITVPAYFSDSQRKATLISASMAGFKAIRLLNEPTAAAMAYGLFLSGKKLVTVFDFGGGTLDVSLLSIEDGKFEVLGIGGDTNLGGDDIDNVLVEHLLEVLYKHHDVTRAQVEDANMVRLKREVEKAKIKLSEEDYADIVGLKIAAVPKFKYTLTRRKFEELCDPIWKKWEACGIRVTYNVLCRVEIDERRCLRIVSSVLKEAEVETTDIDEVILVGGSTRIPILRTKISETFDGKELCMSVNADEVVCEGAAIQAAILSGIDQRVFRDVLMMDVLPLPIGLETADGSMEVILPRNARIPTMVTKYFQTYEDNQRGLTVEVYEGEKEIAKENVHICYFNFAIPRNKIGKAGEFAHPVTFTMNASGILQVQAGVHHDSEETPMSKAAIFLMMGYIFALFAFYVFLRIFFTEERSIAA